MASDETSRIAVNPSEVDYLKASEAINRAGSAQSEVDVAVALRLLSEALGMERFMLIDLKGDLGGAVYAVYHDAPAAIRDEASDLERMNSDAVVQMARVKKPVPFTWDPTFPMYAGSFYERHADAGYRSGIASMHEDPSGATAVVMMSSSAAAVAEPVMLGAMGLCSLMAGSLLKPLALLRPIAERSPLAYRERDCLICVMAGLSAKETARHLGIGTRTIGQYLERARLKLGASSSFAAGVLAVQKGWISMQEVNDLTKDAPRRSAG